MCTWLDFIGIDGFALSWSGMDGQPLLIGSKDVQRLAELQDDPPHVGWIALRGDGKVVMQTFMPSPDLGVLRPQLYYLNGMSRSEASEGPINGMRRLGYLMTKWENLSPGTHRLDSVLLVLPDDSDPDHVARELAAPLSVAVAHTHS